MTDIKLNEPQNEFLFNLLDECDELVRMVNNKEHYDEHENMFGDVSSKLLSQVSYVQFCADTFMRSVKDDASEQN